MEPARWGGNCHFKLSIHISAPFTVPIWYYTTRHNDVATLPGRFIFQPYVSKDRTSVDRQRKKKKKRECVMDAFKKRDG